MRNVQDVPKVREVNKPVLSPPGAAARETGPSAPTPPSISSEAGEATAPWPFLSFSGNPEDEASVASAIRAADEADARGEPSYRPWTEEQAARSRLVRVGPGLKRLRESRSPEELALMREVAGRITAYRGKHRLSQRALAEQLGMPQPNLARLEAYMHTPTLETLARLSRGLGITFSIDITPQGVRLRPAA